MESPEAMAAEFRRILDSRKIAEDSGNEVLTAVGETVFGRGEDGSVDMAAHNRRYHPNGLTENTHCKYLVKGESAGEWQQDTESPRNVTENLKKSGFDFAEKWLKENGNILTFHATTQEDLDFMGLNDFAKEKMKKGCPLGREAFEKVVKSVCRECQYLKRRFPNIRFGFDVLYPYEVSGSDIGGISSLDRRSGFGCLIIGDENNFYRIVGNRDERAYRWVIRHELGHSLSSAEISKRFDDVIENKFMEKYGKDRLRTFLKKICNVGEAWLTANNAVEKTSAKEEIIADIFALYTAPEYKKGYLPKELEDFCEEMIKGEHLQQQNGMLAMDGKEKKIQYPRHLRYVEGLFESKAMHNPPRGSTRPYALNCIKDKWEFFDTIEERDAWAKKHEKECRRNTMEDARAWMEQELPKIVAYIRGKGKNSPCPSRDEGEKNLNEYAADAVEGAFGIGEDALDPADADFWAKHDKARHGGHFDPETMTCKLREKYEQGEKIENLKDEMDDIEGEVPDVGSSGDIASRQGGDLNSDPDYGIISEVLNAEKERQNGKPAQLHQRVPEEALRGSDEGTRILREASLVCRATEGTGSQGEGNSGGGDGRGEGAAEGAVSGVEQAREASRRQEAILEKYAKKLGIWEDDAATALKERDDYDYIEGGETIAFFPDDTSKPLTKVITSAYFPETVQLLDRIILHNYLFPYSKLNVKGFGRARPDWLTDGEPMFCVKVEQQAVDTSCPAKPEQIEEYMKNLGFHKHRELAGGDVVWESNDGKYVVSDLTDENVFLTQDGHIAVIDANIQLNTPDSDGSGRYRVPPYREVSVGNGKKFTAKKNELVDKVSGRGMDGEDFFKGLIALAGGDGTVKKMEYAARRMTSQHPVAKLVSGQEFFNIISKAKDSRPDKDKWRVDVHEASDYEKDKCFATEGGSVFAIAGEDIISVCKNPDDRICSGAMLIEQAVKEGGRKLDSYEGNHAFYAKCGFEPVSWTKFNPEYAAPGTPPEDVIFYIYTGNKRKMTVDESHDELEKFKASVTAKDYDEAGKIRDEILMSRG